MDAVGDQAGRVVAKATAEESERAKPRLPERPFVTGVVSFLVDRDAALRWLMLTLLLQAAVVLFGWIVELSRGSGIAQMGALLMTLAAAFLTLLFAATAAASCLAILQDTASGRDKIENWPGMQITDWMMDVFYVVNALLTAALPGLFMGGTWMCLGGKVGSAIYGGASSSIALFPLFLISMVTEGSTFSVASPAVWGTVRTQPRLWGKFYLLSAAVGLVLLVLGRIMVGSGFFLQGLCSAVAVAAMHDLLPAARQACLVLIFRSDDGRQTFAVGRIQQIELQFCEHSPVADAFARARPFGRRRVAPRFAELRFRAPNNAASSRKYSPRITGCPSETQYRAGSGACCSAAITALAASSTWIKFR